MKKLLFLMLTLALSAAPALADYSETREMEISADDVAILRIDCGAGFLEIKGIEGLESIKVKAEIFLDDMSGNQVLTEVALQMVRAVVGSGIQIDQVEEVRARLVCAFHLE